MMTSNEKEPRSTKSPMVWNGKQHVYLCGKESNTCVRLFIRNIQKTSNYAMPSSTDVSICGCSCTLHLFNMVSSWVTVATVVGQLQCVEKLQQKYEDSDVHFSCHYAAIQQLAMQELSKAWCAMCSKHSVSANIIIHAGKLFLVPQ